MPNGMAIAIAMEKTGIMKVLWIDLFRELQFKNSAFNGR